MKKLTGAVAVVGFLLCGVFLLDSPQRAQEEVQVYPDVLPEIQHGVSPLLREIPPRRAEGPPREIPILRTHGPQSGAGQPDGALQTSVLQSVSATLTASFDGVGANGSAPPDTNGAAGATQF